MLGEDGKPIRVGKGVVTVGERARILASLRSRTSEALSTSRRGKPAAQSLLSGFLRCGRCNGNMVKSGRAYRCYRRHNLGRNACQGMAVLVRDLDSTISAAFMARVRSFTYEHALFKELATRWLAYDDPESDARRVELVAGLEDCQSRLASLEDAYYVKARFKGASGELRYERLREAIESQLEVMGAELAEITEAVDLSVLRDPDRLHEAWRAADQEQARMLLRVVLHSVRVLPSRGQGCKRSWYELLSDCCFHWVGEKPQSLTRDRERLEGLILFDGEYPAPVSLAA
ncbi:zinc ribbon domain-containing protein [Streptomyces formicae]